MVSEAGPKGLKHLHSEEQDIPHDERNETIKQMTEITPEAPLKDESDVITKAAFKKVMRGHSLEVDYPNRTAMVYEGSQMTPASPA